MSGLRARIEKMLDGWLPSLSDRRRDWVKAALAELPEVPDRRVPGWALGVGAIAVRDLAEQAFLPWRRGKDTRPPAGFAALLGLILLALPIYYLAAVFVWQDWTFGRIGTLISLGGTLLCLWLNLAAVLKADSLGGLHYAVGVRVLPRNIGLVLAAAALGFVVFNAPLV